MTSDTRPSSAAVRLRQLAAIGGVAVALRVLLFVLAARLTHVGFAENAYVNDGGGYIHYGEWIAGRPVVLTDYERRLFPGTPMAIALLLKLGVAPYWAALLPNWLGAAAGAVGAAVLFRSAAVGWATAVLLPDTLVVTAVVASEGLMLGLSVWGLVLARQTRWTAGGLLLGLAAVARPMACFAVVGFVASEWSRRRWRGGWVVGLVSAAVVAVALAWLHGRLGSALTPAREYRDADSAYRGELFSWPFHSLLYYTLHDPSGRAKVLFVWAHVGLAFGVVTVLARRVRRVSDDGRTGLALAWGRVEHTILPVCRQRMGLPLLPTLPHPGVARNGLRGRMLAAKAVVDLDGRHRGVLRHVPDHGDTSATALTRHAAATSKRFKPSPFSDDGPAALPCRGRPPPTPVPGRCCR